MVAVPFGLTPTEHGGDSPGVRVPSPLWNALGMKLVLFHSLIWSAFCGYLSIPTELLAPWCPESAAVKPCPGVLVCLLCCPCPVSGPESYSFNQNLKTYFTLRN